MALFAIEDQLERTHTELRDLLEEQMDGATTMNESAWKLRVEFLLEILSEEMRIPNQHRQLIAKENFSEADLLTDHASFILAFRDTTVRIIGGLCDRDRVQAARRERNSQPDDGDEDAETQHLAHISHALNLGITTWCRHFGHLAQLTCGQVAGSASLSPSKETTGHAAVFLWCGQDAQQSLQGVAEIASSKKQTWPAAELPTLGQAPHSEPRLPQGGRLPGFRTQDRASRSATRGLRALLRGGIGAAGQYVINKQGPPRANDLFENR